MFTLLLVMQEAFLYFLYPVRGLIPGLLIQGRIFGPQHTRVQRIAQEYGSFCHWLLWASSRDVHAYPIEFWRAQEVRCYAVVNLSIGY